MGRREALDILQQAQGLQAVLQDLVVWAQKLREEMAALSNPCSCTEAQRMVREHRARKVSREGDPGIPPLLLSLLPPHCPLSPTVFPSLPHHPPQAFLPHCLPLPPFITALPRVAPSAAGSFFLSHAPLTVLHLLAFGLHPTLF